MARHGIVSWKDNGEPTGRREQVSEHAAGQIKGKLTVYDKFPRAGLPQLEALPDESNLADFLKAQPVESTVLDTRTSTNPGKAARKIKQMMGKWNAYAAAALRCRCRHRIAPPQSARQPVLPCSRCQNSQSSSVAGW